jgi:integrase
MGQIIPWLFHVMGGRSEITVDLITACKRAGAPGRVPHDFRRTAVRKLEPAGVPRSAAMENGRSQTESIYRRNAIADDSMLKDAADKLAQFPSFISANPKVAE